MKNITQSASKLVLLWLVFILGMLSLVAGIHSILVGTLDKASEIILGAMFVAINLVLGFYFGYKGDNPNVTRETPDTGTNNGSAFGK